MKPGLFDAARTARNLFHLVITLCAPNLFGLGTRGDRTFVEEGWLKGNIHISFSLAIFATLAVVFLTAMDAEGAKNFSKEK